MSRLRASHVAGFEESDFSHYQKVTKVLRVVTFGS